VEEEAVVEAVGLRRKSRSPRRIWRKGRHWVEV
jgi:hypothetical protein